MQMRFPILHNFRFYFYDLTAERTIRPYSGYAQEENLDLV